MTNLPDLPDGVAHSDCDGLKLDVSMAEISGITNFGSTLLLGVVDGILGSGDDFGPVGLVFECPTATVAERLGKLVGVHVSAGETFRIVTGAGRATLLLEEQTGRWTLLPAATPTHGPRGVR